MQDEKRKNGNVSDAELDALLAEWAEGEIEPPAGFHETAMKRLRAEAQPVKKQNNIVSLFAKNKRWTSIAAAAVLMLFCVPVVQGQLGGDATQSMKDTVQAQQLQVAQDNNKARMTDEALNGADGNKQQSSASVDTASNLQQTDQKEKTVGSAVGQELEAGDKTMTVEYAANAADENAELANVPMMASLDDGAELDGSARMTEFDYAANEKTLEELETELEELQQQLAQYQAQLDTAPDDTNLQLIVKEQQQAIEDVEAKIEELKAEKEELKKVEAE